MVRRRRGMSNPSTFVGRAHSTINPILIEIYKIVSCPHESIAVEPRSIFVANHAQATAAQIWLSPADGWRFQRRLRPSLAHSPNAASLLIRHGHCDSKIVGQIPQQGAERLATG